jgi:catechol 2,3-dioxygenase-like lactoylglutathione lyase family enzyme
MRVEQINHVAYRCKDAAETVKFYRENLGMAFIGAFSEDRVPSTGESTPYMHVFLDAGNGNILAFFELPQSPPMGRDLNTPEWVQHIAFTMKDADALNAAKKELEANGVEVVGPTDHSILQSIYFFDPNGHRLELTAWTATQEMMKKMAEAGEPMLEEWTKSKQTVRQASWAHQQA